MRKDLKSRVELESQISQLQKEQNEAVSNEDFGMADKINQSIDDITEQMENFKYRHPLLDKKVCASVRF